MDKPTVFGTTGGLVAGQIIVLLSMIAGYEKIFNFTLIATGWTSASIASFFAKLD